VRHAGSTVKGGWSDYDWNKAAIALLKEAHSRYLSAKTVADTAEKEGRPRNDGPVTEAIVLGLTVALQEGVFDDWLSLAVRQAPTIRGLASLLPNPTQENSRDPASALVRHVQALALPTSEAIPILSSLWNHSDHGSRAVTRSSGLWLAYRLRSVCRFQESLDQLQGLITDWCDGDALDLKLLHSQVATTFRMERLYGQALEYRTRTLGVDDVGSPEFKDSCWRDHGFVQHERGEYEDRIDRSKSARYRLELRTSFLRQKLFSGEDCRVEASMLLDKSVEMAMPDFQMSCLHTLGAFQLARPSDLANTIHRMQQLLPQYHGWSSQIGELLTLRAFLTGDPEDLATASQTLPKFEIRPYSCILTEVLLDYLGSPWPTTGQPEEWLIPYEEVCTNWRQVAEGVVERAKSLA